MNLCHCSKRRHPLTPCGMNLCSSCPILSLRPINNVTPTLKRCHDCGHKESSPADTEPPFSLILKCPTSC